MHSIGPLIGMVLLGIVAGWLLGRLCCKAGHLTFLAVVVFVALELIGYKIASIHADALLTTAQSAADQAVDAARSSRGVFWRVATYNIPFTLGFFFGLYRALASGLRRR